MSSIAIAQYMFEAKGRDVPPGEKRWTVTVMFRVRSFRDVFEDAQDIGRMIEREGPEPQRLVAVLNVRWPVKMGEPVAVSRTEVGRSMREDDESGIH